MIIGVPKEIKPQENRIAAVPAMVHDLVQAGHTVLVQRGGGLGAGLRDSQYEAAGRQDLADQEGYEIEVCQGYMPAAMGEDEIAAVITEALGATGAASMKDMGRVMGLVRPKVQGRADMAQVSALIKQRLGG